MNEYPRLKLFSLLYGLVYTGFFLYSESCACAMFRYYPLLGGFYREAQPFAQAGFPINWYSWLAGAFVVSTVLAFLVPPKLAGRLPHSWIWGLNLAVIVGIMVYERRWFY